MTKCKNFKHQTCWFACNKSNTVQKMEEVKGQNSMESVYIWVLSHQELK